MTIAPGREGGLALCVWHASRFIFACKSLRAQPSTQRAAVEPIGVELARGRFMA